jgi:hypothetical protein
MSTTGDIYPPRPDAVTLANGKIYCDHEKNKAFMEGTYNNRMIKVVIQYPQKDFTEEQARGDFNKTLKKIGRLGTETFRDVYTPSKNVKVYFDDFVQAWEANTDAGEIKMDNKMTKLKKTAESTEATKENAADKTQKNAKWVFPKAPKKKD